MTRFHTLAPSRRASLRDETGVTLIVVMALLLVGTLMGAAGLAEALSTSGRANRDTRVRRAQQAADAGVQAQLYQQSEVNLGSASYNLNGGVIGLSNFLDCTVPQLNASLQVTGLVSVAAATAGACPQAESSGGVSTSNTTALGDHAYEQSEFFPGQQQFLNGVAIGSQTGSAERELSPTIVSLGWDDNGGGTGTNPVYAREVVTLAPLAALQAIEGEHSVTIGGLQVCLIVCTSLASTLNGDVLSGGNLTTPSLALLGLNLSNGLLATLAYSGTLSGGLSIANIQKVSSSSIVPRPAVTISSSKPDCSVAANCTALGSAYNATADTFSLSSGSVTFQPGDYVFCNFNATGGTINVNPSSSSPVRIYIDSPTSSRCSGDGFAETGGVWNGGNFNDTAGFSNGLLGTGGVLASSGMQVYVVGDGSNDDATAVQIGPTSTTGLLSLTAATYGAVVYAPTSKVAVSVPAACVTALLCTGGVFEGAVVGNDTTVNALTVTQDLDIGNYPLYGGISAFRPTQYVECGANNASGSPVSSLTGALATDTSGC